MRRLRLVPRGVAARIALTVVLGLAATQVITFGMFLAFRPAPPPAFPAAWLIDAIAGAASEVFQRPLAERSGTLPKLSEHQDLTLTWQRDEPALSTRGRAPHFNRLHRDLVAALGPTAKQVIVAGEAPPGMAVFDWLRPPPPEPPPVPLAGTPGPGPAAALRPPPPPVPGPPGTRPPIPPDLLLVGRFTIAVEGQDGTWLVAATPRVWSRLQDPIYVALWLVLVGGAIAGISVWSARRLIRPLDRLARAAERLGVEREASPIPEQGPSEFRVITRAFNDMQLRLKRFVDDRTQMLAAISHDLRTPLTRLTLRAEFVSDGEQQRRMLDEIQRMQAMIDATLAFATQDSRKEAHQAADLAEMVQGICDDMEDAGLVASYAGPAHAAYPCQPTALRRALTNVIENACRHGGGAKVTLRDAAGAATLVVADDGAGIPEDRFDQVFQPFHRLEASRNPATGGVGLGLTIARTILRAHGGDIQLANREPHGLKATITLPKLAAIAAE